jgi:hypothetical protein
MLQMLFNQNAQLQQQQAQAAQPVPQRERTLEEKVTDLMDARERANARASPLAAYNLVATTMASAIHGKSDRDDIKRCDHAMSDSPFGRMTFVDKCEKLKNGDNYYDCWQALVKRSCIVSNNLQDEITDQCTDGQMSKDIWLQVKQHFVLLYPNDADKILDEATTALSTQNKKNLTIAKFYGQARGFWEIVKKAYKLTGEQPATVSHNAYITAFVKALPGSDKLRWHVTHKMTTNKNKNKEFDLQIAYQTASSFEETEKRCPEPTLPVKRPYQQAFPQQPVANRFRERAPFNNIIQADNMSDNTMQPRNNTRSGNNANQGTKLPCRFFSQGGCYRAENCMFSHDPSIEAEPANPRTNIGFSGSTRNSSRPSEICRNYRMGRCRNGNKCRNVHSGTVTLDCRKCHGKTHTYGTDCPQYSGCYRCGDLGHMTGRCNNPCQVCNAPGGARCDQSCRTMNQQLFRRQERSQ